MRASIRKKQTVLRLLLLFYTRLPKSALLIYSELRQ